jgi:hypothetical protein
MRDFGHTPTATDCASAAQSPRRRQRDRPLGKEDEVQHPMTDQLRDKARALGLDRLTDEHLEQFERATAGMERHLKRLPRDMPPAHEPAHIYRAKRQIP